MTINTDDMTQEEQDAYRFRVGRTRFEDAADAIFYAESAYDADRVELLWPDGSWRTWWQDGDIEYTRPGFAVVNPWRPHA